jgi:transposase
MGKEFFEAGKKRLDGNTMPETTSSEVRDLKKENDRLNTLMQSCR